MTQAIKDVIIVSAGVTTLLLLLHVKIGKQPKKHQLPPAEADPVKINKKRNAVKALSAFKAAVNAGENTQRLMELNGLIAQRYGVRVKSAPGGQWVVLDDVSGEQITVDKS